MQKNIKGKLKEIPHKPGCYRYFDKSGRLIYIGKAKDLKKRVSSYFIGANDPKTTVLVENIANIEWETTESEIEALVLESLLIKKFKPKFNIKVKDDKDFLWVKINFKKPFPYPELVRKPEPEPKVKLFGPFTDSRLLKEGLTVLRKIFVWRDCSESKFSFYRKKKKPCLEYYIKNCNAPCCNYINDNDYQLGIGQLIMFLQGGKKRLTGEFKKRMKVFSKKKEFEKAAVYRDKLRSLQHMDASRNFQFPISQASPDHAKRDNFQSNPNDQFSNVKKIIQVLNNSLGYELKYKKNFRIEFYDISNISGREAVGSMIVWQGNYFKKSEYRKFKIKFTKGPNDVGMMREVLFRRIRKIKNQKSKIKNSESLRDDIYWPTPNLIVLDGGKPQLGEIWKLFQQLKIEIPLLSLAKREEEVFGVKDGHFKKTNVRKNSPEGFFIQRLRDEAHRFAIGYHKNLRTKKMVKSRLDDIDGIGPVTKKKLLLKFGSVEGIIRANSSEIADVVGKKMAKIIKEKL